MNYNKKNDCVLYTYSVKCYAAFRFTSPGTKMNTAGDLKTCGRVKITVGSGIQLWTVRLV